MKNNHSRSMRFGEAISKVSDARVEIDELKDELQQWLDNMPENLQSSIKANALETAIDALDEISSYLSDAEGTDVEFPGMY